MAERKWSSPRMFLSLHGDKTAAKRLERKARIYAGYLFDQLRGNQTYRTQTWTGADGSVIQVFVWRDALGERAIANLFAQETQELSALSQSLILESGLLQIVNEGGGIFSSLLYLGEKVSTQYSDLTCICAPENNGTADARMFPVGSMTLPVPITVPIVGDIDPGLYSPSASRVTVSEASKAYKLLLPASVFSGKLRLFVQSLYSIARTDYTVGLNAPSMWPSLTVNSNEIDYRGRNSSFLITTDNWDYWLATPAVNSDESTFEVRINKLIPRSTTLPPLAQWAKTKLQETGEFSPGSRVLDEQAILESLLLSELTIQPDVFHVLEVSYPTIGFPLGNPLGYGWHSNWEGSEARLVAVTTDTAGFAFGSTELQLSVQHSIDPVTGDVEFSASLAHTTPKTVQVGNDFCVWVPNGVFQTSSSSWLTQLYMCGVADPGSAVITGAPEDCANLLLYGWFDKDEDWVQCSFSRESMGPAYATKSRDLPIICHGQTDYEIPEAGEGEVTNHRLAIGSTQMNVLTCMDAGARVITYSITSGSSTKVRSDFVNQSYGAYSACTEEAFPGYDGSLYRAGWFYYIKPVHKTTIQDASDIQYVGRVSLVLPHNECDSAIGVQHQDTLVGRIQINPGNPTELSKISGPIYSQVVEDIGGIEGEEVLWSGYDVRGVANVGGSGISVYFNNLQKTQVEVVVGHQDGITNVVSYIVATNNTIDPGYDFEWNGGLADLPSPFGESSSASSRDWETFSDAPFGVCSAGVRDVSLDPMLMVSAGYLSFLGGGQPNDMADLTDDGFASGHTFIGWA